MMTDHSAIERGVALGWKLVPEASLLSVIASIDQGCDPADKHNITVNEHYGVLRKIALSAAPAPDVEIVAKAICECQGRDWSKLFESSKDWWRVQARAALSAAFKSATERGLSERRDVSWFIEEKHTNKKVAVENVTILRHKEPT